LSIPIDKYVAFIFHCGIEWLYQALVFRKVSRNTAMRSCANRADYAMVVRSSIRTQAMPQSTLKEICDGEEKSREEEGQEEVVCVSREPGEPRLPSFAVSFFSRRIRFHRDAAAHRARRSKLKNAARPFRLKQHLINWLQAHWLAAARRSRIHSPAAS
jgi:hypothetical protein